MMKPVAVLTIVCVLGVTAQSASARPHHRRSAAAGGAPASIVLRVGPTYSRFSDDKRSRDRMFAVGPIGAADRIPLGAADHFGRGGVASIGYQTNAMQLPVEAHEINAAFSAQSIGFGGLVGGGVSIKF